MPYTFQNNNISFTLKHKAIIKQVLTNLIVKSKKKLGQINFVFTSDNELLKYNQDYLQHNTFTDIITFDYSNEKLVSGDILISIERVKDNAKKFEVDLDTELHRVMAHGVLHLLGFKDKRKTDIVIMRQQEAIALKQFKRLLP